MASRGPQDLADRSAALAIVGDLRQQALSRATAGANRRWPDILANRLQAAGQRATAGLLTVGLG